MEQLIEMWRILGKYHFEIDPKVLIYVKCSICNGLLRDAFRGPCWCNYCRTCIEVYLGNVRKYCPGDNTDCRLEYISMLDDIVKDRGADNRVSQLFVRCPCNSCSFQGKLLNMNDHLRTCNKRPIECPFLELGCQTILTENENIKDHLLDNIFQHNKLIMNLITILKDETLNCEGNATNHLANVLRQNIIVLVDRKINQIRLNLRNAEINHLLEEIRIQSAKRKRLKDELKILENNYEQKILFHKSALEKQQNQIEFLVRNICQKDQFLVDQHGNDDSKSIEKCNINQENRKDYLCETQPEMKASFAWVVTEISRKKKYKVNLKSENFYSNDCQYEMSLILYPGGYERYTNTHISIAFYIRQWKRLNQSKLFPIKCNILIRISNKFQISSQLKIVKDCSFISQHSNSEIFNFSFDELEQLAVTWSDIVVIECHVEGIQ